MAKIMLVEDDNHLRDIYEARLIAEGYDVVSSGDGEAALASVVKEKPDLIISDVMMPKISGFDMLDILRSTPEVAHTKVIMMTALSQAEDRTRASSLGADKYLVKSQVTLEDVVRTVHEVLGDDNPQPVQPVSTPSVSAPVPTPVVTQPTPTTQPVTAPTTNIVANPTAQSVAAAPATNPVIAPSTNPVIQPQPVPTPSVSAPASTPVVTEPTPTAQPVTAPTTPQNISTPISPIRPVEVSNQPIPEQQTPAANLQQKIDTASVATTFMSPGTIVNPTSNITQNTADDSLESAFDAQTAYNDVLKSIGASTSPDNPQSNQNTPPLNN